MGVIVGRFGGYPSACSCQSTVDVCNKIVWENFVFWDGFVSAPCSALAACEVPFLKLRFSLAFGFFNLS